MRFMTDRILPGFVLRLLFWLPLAFLTWYLLAQYLLVPLGWLAWAGLELVVPGKIEGLSMAGRHLVLDTNLEFQAGDGRLGYLTLTLNPLQYCWNLPLLLAMTLAAGLRHRVWVRITTAYLGLLPFQAWGVVFDFLKISTLQMGPEISAQMGYSELGRNIIILGYQFGYLMLPAISASALWIIMHRWFIRELLAEQQP